MFTVGVDRETGCQVFLREREIGTFFLQGTLAVYIKHLKCKHTLGPVKHISRSLSFRNNQMIHNVESLKMLVKVNVLRLKKYSVKKRNLRKISNYTFPLYSISDDMYFQCFVHVL